MGISIHSLSSWQKLPYLHQSPTPSQKGVQVRLKESIDNSDSNQNATEKQAGEWHAELVTTCVNQRPSCFNARSKSSQDSSCKLATKEKPQTTEASYRHQQRYHLSSYPETCFGSPRHLVRFSCCPIACRAIETCWRTTAKGSALGKKGLLLAWPGLGFRQWQCMGQHERHWSLICKEKFVT